MPWHALRPVATPHDLIPRDEIAAALDSAIQTGAITLVIAPSGFGKSTAVADWFRRAGDARWVTAVPFTDPRVLVTAGLGGGIENPADADSEPPADSAGTGFIGWLTAFLQRRPTLPVVLVIDDAHLIEPAQLAAMLDAAAGPLQDGALRLVLLGQPPLSRIIPHLPGPAVTIGPQQLAFTPADLRRSFGDDAGPLHERTGGWPIAVRFLTLEQAGDRRQPPPTVLNEDVFGEYLERFVLAGLPAPIRDAVYDTAVLGAFELELAKEVLGDDVVHHLERIVDGGLFLTRIQSADRNGYAWPELVGEHCARLAQRRDPARVSAIHVRAAQALRGEQPILAAGHALRGNDQPLSVDVISSAWPRLLLSRNVRALDAVCLAITTDTEIADLLRIRAACQHILGMHEVSSMLLGRARELEARAPDGPASLTAVVTDAFLATGDGASTGAVELAFRRLAAPQPGEDVLHCLLLANWINVRLRIDPDPAAITLAALTAAADAAGLPGLVRQAHMAQLWAQCYSGRLTDAAATLEIINDNTDTTTDWLVFQSGVTECVHGFVSYWRGDAEEAIKQMQAVLANPECAHEVRWIATLYLIVAIADRERRDLATTARRHLADIPEDARFGLVWGEHRRASTAYLSAVEGNRHEAVVLAASVSVETLGLLEMTFVADLLRRCGESAQARRVVEQIERDASLPDHGLANVGLLVTKALLAAESGQRQNALELTGLALTVASGEGIWQPFLRPDQGLDLLLHSVREAGGGWAPTAEDLLRRRGHAAAARTPELTNREHEILAGLSTSATLSEVADQLGVSVNTVKSHTRAIYRKLGVENRRAAVREARRLLP